MASERLQVKKISLNYLFETPRFHAKMHLKSEPQKLLAHLSISALVEYCKT